MSRFWNPRRRRSAYVVAPVWLVLVLVAVLLLTKLADNAAGRESYVGHDPAGARQRFERTQRINVVEPWIAHFNHGTAAYQLRRYAEARTDFSTALASVPKTHDCMVRLNLVETIERMGDELAAARSFDAARVQYEEALRVLRAGSCGDRTPDPSASPSAEPSASPSRSGTPSRSASSAPGSSESATPGRSGAPSPGHSGEPTSGPSGVPSSRSSGQPTNGPSGQPTSGPSGQPTQGEQKSDEERRQEEKRRAEEAEKRLEKKQKDASGQGQKGATQSPSPTSQPSPAEQDEQGEAQRQQKLEKQNKDARKENQEGRDRKDRTGPRVDRPW
ncbi:hypothetical protein GCM10027418_30190 [Mariniluteicoccus endophyticus]